MTYGKVETQLHVASQMIALTGINCVKKQADDSHTTIKWKPEVGRLEGRPFVLSGSTYSVFVNPLEFTLGILKDGSVHETIPMDGKTYAETIAPWKKWLKKAGFQDEPTTELHYDLPDDDNYRFNAFEKPNDEVLKQWADLRTLANKALEQLTETIGVPSEVNIWPHHFDTGTYYELHQTDGETDRSIGAGLAIADGMVEEPYFYIYAWYKDHDIDYSDTPKLKNGKWIRTDGWNGAALPASELARTTLQGLNGFFSVTSSYLQNKIQ